MSATSGRDETTYLRGAPRVLGLLHDPTPTRRPRPWPCPCGRRFATRRAQEKHQQTCPKA